MRIALCATLLGVAACALRDVPGPPGEEQVVVQGVLSAQTAQQVLWIERTIPAGDPVGTELRPLASPPARVEVRDSTGAVFTFQMDAANPARFLASFTPTPGWRYDLLLEAGARVLTASTRVPAALTILNPTADTVTMPRDSFAITWSGPVRAIRIAYADTAGRPAYGPPSWVTADTVTRLSYIVYFPSSVATFQVWVVAVDSVTARLRQPSGFFGPFGDAFNQDRGNLTGGVGFFGAVTGDRLVVKLQ